MVKTLIVQVNIFNHANGMTLILKTNGLIAMKLCTDIHCPQRIN